MLEKARLHKFLTHIRHLHQTPVVQKGRFRFFNVHKVCTDPKEGEPYHFNNEGLKVEFGLNYIDTLTGIWEKRRSVSRDVHMKSDDFLIKHDSRYWLPDVDKNDIVLKYSDVDALKDAPELVRKMFTLEYGSRQDSLDIWKKIMLSSFQRHKLDDGLSLAAQIARKTFQIRQWTMLLESQGKRRPGWMAQIISLAVDKRRKLLKMLRWQDEAEFNRLIKELKIAYHVPPPTEDLPMFTRKGWIEYITKIKCEKLKDDRLRQYHAKLKLKQLKFLDTREERLSKLNKERDDLRQDISAIRNEDDQVLDVVGRYSLDTISDVSENLILHYFYLQAWAKKQETKQVFDNTV